MAAKLSGGGSSKFTTSMNSEINVTPFVDVMLVLLIIFMVAAPLATVTIKVDLPPAVAPISQTPPKPIYISLKADGRVAIGDDYVDIDELGADMVKQVGARDPSKERIYIRGDKKVRYGTFMQVMNQLLDNGFYSVALVGKDVS
ncbi:MAG: biopolymer transporter ExbD [Proteobacteria bacterium]|nr:biopolymer transporter ExbD [Pseudomonadota bacterium]